MMSLTRLLFFLLCISTLLSSCSLHPYQTRFKRHQITNAVHEYRAPVYVGDYVICKNLHKSFRNLEFPGNHDHYMYNFLYALKGLFDVTVLDDAQNRCFEGFFDNHNLNQRKMEVDSFPNLFRIQEKGVHVVPLIYLYNMWLSNMYVTSSGSVGATGTGKERTTFLIMAIYIYHDAELVYRKQMWFRAKPRDIRDDFEDDFNLNKGHWNRLVKKVLDDYIVY